VHSLPWKPLSPCHASKGAIHVEDSYDIEGQSPCFDVYKKLYKKSTGIRDSDATSIEQVEERSGLDLLAEAAAGRVSSTCGAAESLPALDDSVEMCDKADKCVISPSLRNTLTFPEAPAKTKMRHNILDDLPDSLTSPECIRAMALKEISKARVFAQKEHRAKEKFLRTKVSAGKKDKKQKPAKKRKTVSASLQPSTLSLVPTQGVSVDMDTSDNGNDGADVTCMGCHMSWTEDMTLGMGTTWIQCDTCRLWIHADCSNTAVADDDKFCCPD
jgi:hypothetical protein